MHHLRNSKYWPFPTYLPLGSCTRMDSSKNVTVKMFAQSHVRIRVSIGFSRLQNLKYWPFLMF
ncbi:hypothetical protein BHM03_00060839 [Ensete ventricosum]|nr:hypothetical protein BHM03_00060839 [Ensete ventricosum]